MSIIETLSKDLEFRQGLAGIREACIPDYIHIVNLSYRIENGKIITKIKTECDLPYHFSDRATRLREFEQRLQEPLIKMVSSLEYLCAEKEESFVTIRLKYDVPEMAAVDYIIRRKHLNPVVHRNTPVKFSENFHEDLSFIFQHLKKIQLTHFKELQAVNYFEMKSTEHAFLTGLSPMIRYYYPEHLEPDTTEQDPILVDFYQKCKKQLSSISERIDPFSILIDLHDYKNSLYTTYTFRGTNTATCKLVGLSGKITL